MGSQCFMITATNDGSPLLALSSFLTGLTMSGVVSSASSWMLLLCRTCWVCRCLRAAEFLTQKGDILSVINV